MFSQETIREPDGSVEALKQPEAILTSLEAVHQYTGQPGRLTRAESAMKRPI